MRVFFLLSVAQPAYALLRNQVNIITGPCAASTAALISKEAADSTDGDYWVAVERTEPSEHCLPLAVGRIRRTLRPHPLVDCLRSSLPKEDPLAKAALELALDALLLRHAETSSDARRFETLRAASSVFTSAVLESRGFAEVDAPDFTAIGRGERIATHAARLPAAIFAAKTRAGSAGIDTTAEDKDHALALAVALGRLDPPNAGEDDEEQPPPKRDPFAGASGLFGGGGSSSRPLRL
jgi:hypothetical protein